MASNNRKYWDYLGLEEGKKYPHSSAEKHYYLCEKLVDPDVQKANIRSLFFPNGRSKHKEIWEPYTDVLGRKITPHKDIFIVPGKRATPLLTWKVEHYKGSKFKKVVGSCITPGYEKYRCAFHSHEILIITDQVVSNHNRNHQIVTIAGKEFKAEPKEIIL